MVPDENGSDQDPSDGPRAEGEVKANTGAVTAHAGRLQCPFCNSYDVGRMFLASVNMDACECVSCGARWDEERGSGRYRGRSDRGSILIPRQR